MAKKKTKTVNETVTLDCGTLAEMFPQYINDCAFFPMAFEDGETVVKALVYMPCFGAWNGPQLEMPSEFIPVIPEGATNICSHLVFKGELNEDGGFTEDGVPLANPIYIIDNDIPLGESVHWVITYETE